MKEPKAVNRRAWSRRAIGSALLSTPLASAVTADGLAPAVFAWGHQDWYGETVVPQIAGPVIDIAAGSYHSIALAADGTVHGWGQLAVPKGLGTVTAIAAGATHAVALRSDGTVRCWGADDYGQSTVPAQAVSVVRIAAGHQHTLAASASGSVLAWGRNDGGQSTVPANLEAVIALSGGAGHSMALRGNGTVVCWGANDAGQGTVPSAIGTVTAIAAGDRHSVALRANGTVVCWGANDRGQCNVPPGLDAVTTIAAGLGRTAVLRSGNLVACDDRFLNWGDDSLGQLEFNGPFNLSDIALGDLHTVGLGSQGDSGSDEVGRHRSSRLLTVSGSASVAVWPWSTSLTGIASSASGAGLPDGRHGRWSCEWWDYFYPGYCAMASVGISGETVQIRQGVDWECWGNCGDSTTACAEVESHLEAWISIDRPHRILIDRLDVYGIEEWQSDPYGGADSGYCSATDPKLRIEAFALSESGAIGPPRPGPWGSHSMDLSPTQQLLITGPSSGPGALSGYAFRITVPMTVVTTLEVPNDAFVDLRLSRAWPAADIVPDGIVDAQDLGAVIAEWGQDCFGRAAADTNLDGRIDGFDLGAVLFAWGTPG